MIIVTKLKLDFHQRPYWSAMLIDDQQNDAIMMQVHSQTFDLDDNFNKWKEYEKTHNRMAIELMNAKHGKAGQRVIAQMLLAPNKYDKTENRF